MLQASGLSRGMGVRPLPWPSRAWVQAVLHSLGLRPRLGDRSGSGSDSRRILCMEPGAGVEPQERPPGGGSCWQDRGGRDWLWQVSGSGSPGGQHQALPIHESLPYLSRGVFLVPRETSVAHRLLCGTQAMLLLCCPACRPAGPACRPAWTCWKREQERSWPVGPTEDRSPICLSSVKCLPEGACGELGCLTLVSPHCWGEAGMPGWGLNGKTRAGHSAVSRARQRQLEEAAELALQAGRVPGPALP